MFCSVVQMLSAMLLYQENIYQDHRDFTIIHTPLLMYGQDWDKKFLNKHAVGR